MGELLDRHYQREILEKLASAYPSSPWPLVTAFGPLDNRFKVNVMYMAEHELLRSKHTEPSPGNIHFSEVKITARGLDFLQDDGGLGAILGVVTIKLQDEDLRKVIFDKISSSTEDVSTKRQLIQSVRSLPSEGLKHVALKLVDQGLDKISSLGPILEAALNG
jgi:hypothetical protein